MSLTSHTHQWGKLFQIKIKGGARDGEVIYEDNDWAHPKVVNYAKPIILKEGEQEWDQQEMSYVCWPLLT